MSEVFNEPKKQIDGVYIPYDCHAQAHVGPGVMAHAHVHAYIEILYGLEGRYTLQTNENSITFSAGDMVLIHAHEVHQVFALAEGTNRYIVIKFEPELVQAADSTVFELKYLLSFRLPAHNLPRFFPRDVLASCEVPDLVRDILREAQNRDFGFELAIRTDICRLALWILRHWHGDTGRAHEAYALSERDMARLKTVFDYVEEHYAQDISLQDCARLCGMSYYAFSRFFRQCAQRTFSEYLNFVRVKKAEMLLASTDMNVTEIALETGFSTSSYFIRRFRAVNSVTPLDFRRLFAQPDL